MYTVKKLDAFFKVHEGKKVYHWNGTAWGVFDAFGVLHYTLNRENKKLYSVFDYKYVAQHEADWLNKNLEKEI